MLYSIACWAPNQGKQSGSSGPGRQGPRAYAMDSFVSGSGENIAPLAL